MNSLSDLGNVMKYEEDLVNEIEIAFRVREKANFIVSWYTENKVYRLVYCVFALDAAIVGIIYAERYGSGVSIMHLNNTGESISVEPDADIDELEKKLNALKERKLI